MTTTAAVPGCPVDESFDPLSPEFLADPYAVLATLPGAGAPVFFAPSIGYYVVTRYRDVEDVFRDPAAYSAAVTQAPLVPITPEAQQILLAGGHKPQPSMVSLDEPEHARLRKPAARGWRPRVGTPPRSPSPTGSTCTGPMPTGTWPSARACTTAWARTSASWRLRSPSPSSPAAIRTWLWCRIRSSPSTPTSRSAGRRSC